MNNNNPERLFDDYQPIKPSERAVKRLERKIKGPSNPRGRQPLYKVGGAFAILFLFLGMVTLYFSDSAFPSLPSSGQKPIETADVTERDYVFSDESEHWKAKVVSDSIELWYEPEDEANPITHDGSGKNELYLTFKGDDGQRFKNFTYEIKGSAFSTKSNDPNAFYNGNTLHKRLNDNVLYKKENITVKVNWDGQEETLNLDFIPSASSEKTYERAVNLSSVEMAGGKELFTGWDALGDAGGDKFQVSSMDWDERMKQFQHFEPSLLAKGKKLSQALIFTFSDQDLFSGNLKIVGEHSDGTEKTLWKGGFNSPSTSQFNDRLALPAVVQFGKPGNWTLTAYDKKKKIGSVSIDVRKQTSTPEYSMLNKDGDVWALRFGMRTYLKPDPEDPNTPILITGDTHGQKIAWLFRNISDGPVIIIGQHESGNAHFLRAFDSLMGAIDGTDFHQIDGPKFAKEGTWTVKAFSPQGYFYPLTFKVKYPK